VFRTAKQLCAFEILNNEILIYLKLTNRLITSSSSHFLKVSRKFSHSYRASLYYQSCIYSSTDALVIYLKNHIKIYIKIYIKTTPTCFAAVTPPSESALNRAYKSYSC
jgi:hypothetical protein